MLIDGEADGSRNSLSFELEAGRIEVHLDGKAEQAEALFAFAERNNPRRAFLFVSKVLGRHIPVRPREMRAAFSALAQGIADDAPGPVLITGMAETAVGLGAGVHDAYVARTGRTDVVYLSTTRTRLGEDLLAEFVEEHSHASGHLVHLPASPETRRLALGARTLVMVDDEASTGRTFRNLADALLPRLPDVEGLHTCVLTDWSAGSREATWSLGAGAFPVRSTFLLTGAFQWRPRPDAPLRRLPDGDVPRRASVAPLPCDDDARLGRRGRSQRRLPPALVEAVRGGARRIIVIGMGEHVWKPFLIAEALEALGHDVVFGSTTRSPILVGGAIAHGLTFHDHEGLGISNYLYNVDAASADRVILCADTPLPAIDPRLIRSLGADLVIGDSFLPREVVGAIIGDGPPAQRLAASKTALAEPAS